MIAARTSTAELIDEVSDDAAVEDSIRIIAELSSECRATDDSFGGKEELAGAGRDDNGAADFAAADDDRRGGALLGGVRSDDGDDEDSLWTTASDDGASLEDASCGTNVPAAFASGFDESEEDDSSLSGAAEEDAAVCCWVLFGSRTAGLWMNCIGWVSPAFLMI